MSGKRQAAAPAGGAPPLSGTAKRVIDKIRRAIMQRNGAAGLKAFARVFRAMDNSGDGLLDRDELRWGLLDYGIQVTDQEFAAMWLAFDYDHSGTVSYNEFIKQLRGEMNEKRKKWVAKAYKVLDADGSGVVDIADIRLRYKADKHPKVLDGSWTVDDALRQMLNKFEKYGDRDGKVSLKEFTAYYTDVSNSIDGDDYFALVIKQAWGL